jgi:pyridinium-3,5-biscarboxylic acid mononucleotide sulfurtransferase
MKTAEEKFRALGDAILSLKGAAVAFSGGADSSFLAKVAHDLLGDRAVAVTVDTPFVPREELCRAGELALRYGILHAVITADPLSCAAVAENPPDRCYHCKLLIISRVRKYAASKSIDAILDGSNYDDTGDYRPGARALSELGVLSPLRDAELTKAEIRELSRGMGLDTWDLPSSSCLAARIPYGERITPEALGAVEGAESSLKRLGFRQVRVRHHGAVARIEVPAVEIERATGDAMRGEIVRELKRCGYTYVTLDLEGYRSGSMNVKMQGEQKGG